MALAGLPPSAARVLDLYRRLLDERAPGLVEGLYLHGSVALGAWVEGKSDLDLVAVLTRPADNRDFAALERAHCDVACAFPRPVLAGVYLQRHDLARQDSSSLSWRLGSALFPGCRPGGTGSSGRRSG